MKNESQLYILYTMDRHHFFGVSLTKISLKSSQNVLLFKLDKEILQTQAIQSL